MERIYNTRRERLRQYMHDHCESKQSELADRVGKATSTVTRWFNEKNRKRIGEDVAREIEEALGKPAYWLDGMADKTDWPFPGIEPDRINRLSSEQRELVERALNAALEIADPKPRPKKNRVA